MYQNFNCLFIIFVFSIVTSCATNNTQVQKKAPTKIAFVGDSITFGARIDNRQKNAYPQQLQAMLGQQYQVGNFGVNGTTLSKRGDFPYWQTKQYEQALAFDPDIVFIKLGTNDSKKRHRVFFDEFERDYVDLVASFRSRNEDVRVVLLLPVPSFSPNETEIWDPVIKNDIIPMIQQVAFNTNSEVINLYPLFIGKKWLFPDLVHPSSLGAAIIAKRLYEAVTVKQDNVFDLVKKLQITEQKTSNFYGFQQTEFSFNGQTSKIVQPKYTAIGKPWVLRARFFGHEPQTDVALLERGFHLVYTDVANLYGSTEAVKRWDLFYSAMVNAGLSTKVVLEGMSRGGLIVYNWAAKNTDKVAAIYADAPVLDIKSWPAGLGLGAGSAPEWEQAKALYNLNTDRAIDNFTDSPIYKASIIATAGFPILHVCGEADKVVPVDENTRLFEQKIKQLGGNIEVIYKPTIGHHPHSLQNPSPIVDFVLNATEKKINFATLVAPGAEYRSVAAGWSGKKGWWGQMEDIDAVAKMTKSADLLLIGDSITQAWGGTGRKLTYKSGEVSAKDNFRDLTWLNAGIAGDYTQHSGWRIKNGSYGQTQAKVVTLAIGVNNFSSNTAEEIAQGIQLNLQLIREKLPKAKVLFFGPLPAGLKPDSLARKKYNKIHALISDLGNEGNIYYYNMLSNFSDEDGHLKDEYYRQDGIHLKAQGYDVWGKFIRERFDVIMKNAN